MKRINRKSQRKPRQTSSRISDQAKIKEFLEENTPGVLGVLEAILEDAFQRLKHYGRADYSRDVATLRRRYVSEGLSFATKTLPTLYNEFLRYLETGKPSYTSFRCVGGAKHPAFLRQLFAMVSKCHDVDACTESMQCLYQLCHAFKKFRGPYRQSTLQKQLWSFVEDDISLRYIDFLSEVNYPILCEARKSVKDIFSGFDPEFDVDMFVPTPGPGATNTPTRKNVRYRPHVLYKQLDDVFPYEDWFYSHPWDVVTGSRRFRALRHIDMPSSRFKFVPKTYGKPRGICIEQLETQFLQQAIKRFMYSRLSTHPLTKGMVNFTDQTVNGKLALSSSSDKSYATLDMSAASDRVSRKLVRYLFKDCPELWRALDATSTRTIELPKEVGIDFIPDFPCAKFAPMGSATCFPTMALVHFVLIKAILTLSQLPHSLTREVYVYGDDIIIRTECVDAVYAYLPFFGMKFNTDKSYSHSWFRESCGVHAFKGVEITPEYFKYLPGVHSPRNVVLSLLSTEARLFRKGFKRTAALLRSQLLKVKCIKGFPLPYVRPKSPILGWIREDKDAPLNRHIGLKRRYNEDFHRFDVYCLVTSPSGDETTIDNDHEAYLRWFCDAGISGRSSSTKSYSYNVPLTPSERKLSAQRLALADHAQTCVSIHVDGKLERSAETVRDSSNDPPRIFATWYPESAL